MGFFKWMWETAWNLVTFWDNKTSQSLFQGQFKFFATAFMIIVVIWNIADLILLSILKFLSPTAYIELQTYRYMKKYPWKSEEQVNKVREETTEKVNNTRSNNIKNIISKYLPEATVTALTTMTTSILMDKLRPRHTHTTNTEQPQTDIQTQDTQQQDIQNESTQPQSTQQIQDDDDGYV